MKTFKQLREEMDPCWKGYRQLGTKKKKGKEVPNCVPEEFTLEEEKYTLKSISELPPNKKTTITFVDGSKKTYDKVVRMGKGLRVYHKDGKNNWDGKPSDNIKLHQLQGAKFKFHEETDIDEATFQGKKVPLNKPMAGDVKKSKVFVDPDGDGKATKVNFGDKNMTIKKHIPARRASFRARHNCDNPGPKDKARYWSCKAW